MTRVMCNTEVTTKVISVRQSVEWGKAGPRVKGEVQEGVW
jgi:hypothetical protein